MKCKNCGIDNDSDRPTCIVCRISMAPVVQAQIEKKNMTCRKCGYQNPINTSPNIDIRYIDIRCQGMNGSCLEIISPYGIWNDQIQKEQRAKYEEKFGPLDKYGMPIDDTPLYKAGGGLFLMYIIPILAGILALMAGMTEIAAALVFMGVLFLLLKLINQD